MRHHGKNEPLQTRSLLTVNHDVSHLVQLFAWGEAADVLRGVRSLYRDISAVVSPLLIDLL